MTTQDPSTPSPSSASTRSSGKARRFNYPLLAATLAVFFLISSIAFAASLPRKSVGSAQLKTNAVTNKKIKKSAVSNAKIKNSAVTGSKVKNDSLTGSDINEATLGTVPSAARAETSLGPVLLRLQSSASAVDFATAQAQATAVPVATVGQLSLYAKCYFNTTTNSLEGALLVSTTADGAVMASTEDNLYGDLNYLNTSTPENGRRVDFYNVANDTAGYSGDDRFMVLGADGRGFQGSTTIWLANGAVPASPLLQGTRQCTIAVTGNQFAG